MLRKRWVHELPLVVTPVVDTESFWGGWNLNPIVRQSASAPDVIAASAMNAKSPVFGVMSAPMPDARFNRSENHAAIARRIHCSRIPASLYPPPLTPR